MVITPHALSGIFIATDLEKLRIRSKGTLNNRFNMLGLSCYLAFLSHFLVDSIPHFDYPIKDSSGHVIFTWILVDTFILCTLFSIVFWKKIIDLNNKNTLKFLLMMISVAIFSMMPDIILATLSSSGIEIVSEFSQFHFWCHSQLIPTTKDGLINEFFYSLFIINMIRISRNNLREEESRQPLNN